MILGVVLRKDKFIFKFDIIKKKFIYKIYKKKIIYKIYIKKNIYKFLEF